MHRSSLPSLRRVDFPVCAGESVCQHDNTPPQRPCQHHLWLKSQIQFNHQHQQSRSLRLQAGQQQNDHMAQAGWQAYLPQGNWAILQQDWGQRLRCSRLLSTLPGSWGASLPRAQWADSWGSIERCYCLGGRRHVTGYSSCSHVGRRKRPGSLPVSSGFGITSCSYFIFTRRKIRFCAA